MGGREYDKGSLFVYFHVDRFDQNHSIFTQADHILYAISLHELFFVLRYD